MQLASKKSQLYNECNGNCPYCGKRLSRKDTTKDHLIPQSQGGTHDIWNLVGCCRKCNENRGNSNYVDWLITTNRDYVRAFKRGLIRDHSIEGKICTSSIKLLKKAKWII